MRLTSHFRKAQPYILAVVCMLVAQVSTEGQTAGPEIEVLDAYGSPLVSGQGTVELAAAAGVARPVVITVRNTGSAALNNVTASLSSSDEFVINYGLPQSIAPGASEQLTITMLAVTSNPSTVLTITSDDSDEPSFSIDLTGQLHAGGPLLVVKRKGSFEVPLHGSNYTAPTGSHAGVVYPGERLQLINYGDENLVGLAAERTMNPGGSGPTFHGPTTLTIEGRTELQLDSAFRTTPDLLKIYTTNDPRPQVFHVTIYNPPPLVIGGNVTNPIITNPIVTNNPVLNNPIGSGLTMSGNTIVPNTILPSPIPTTINGGLPVLTTTNPNLTFLTEVVVSSSSNTWLPSYWSPLNLHYVYPTNPAMPFTFLVGLRLGELDSGAAPGTKVTDTDLRGSFDSSGSMRVYSRPSILGEPEYISSAGPGGSTIGMRFNGSSRITHALALGQPTQWSVECWVRPHKTEGIQCITYNGAAGVGGYGLYQVGDTLRGKLGGVGDVGSFTFAPGQWVHVAMVNKDGVTTFYANGVQAGSSVTAAPSASGSGAITVGSTPAGADFFTGDVDEVRYGWIKPTFNPSLHLQSADVTQALSLTKGGASVGSAISLTNVQMGDSTSTILTLNNSHPWATLSDVSLSIEGPNAADFSFATATRISLNPGPFSTQTFPLRFAPKGDGPRSATLWMRHPSLPGGEMAVELSGVGELAPEIDVEGAPSRSFTLDFSRQTNNGVVIEAVKKLNLRNLGAGILKDIGARITGTDSGNFRVFNIPSELGAGENVELTLIYTSSNQSSKNATLEIASNDLDESPYILTLTAPATGSFVAELPLKGRLAQKVEVINFTHNHTPSVTILNEGHGDLTGLSASIIGAHASDFTITGPSITYVPQNSTTFGSELGITFSAGGPGIRQARLLISSSDPLQSPFEVELVGRKSEPPPAIEVIDNLTLQEQVAGSLVFVQGSFDQLGRAIVGKRMLVVYNRGTGTLRGLKATITQTGTALGVRWLGGDTLLPNQGGQLECSYHPERTGTLGTVALHSNAQSPFTFHVEGYSPGAGKLGIRTLGGTFVNMGVVFSCPPTAVGGSSQLKLEVMNQDSEPHEAVALSGFSEEFSISPKILPKLNPGARTTVTIQFRPSQSGIRPAFQVYIHGRQYHSFYVTGMGVERPTYGGVTTQGHMLTRGDSLTLGPAPQPEDLSLNLIEGRVVSQQKYQWLREGKPILGATQPSLSVINARLSDGGQYDVIVSNEAGSQRLPMATVLVVDKTLHAKSRVLAVGQKTTISAILSHPGLANCEWTVDEPQASLPSGPPSIVVAFATPGRHAISASISSALSTAPIATDPLFIDVVSAAPSIVPPGAQTWTANDPVSLQIAAVGIAADFGMSGQPPGLAISPAGLITGRPTRGGQFTMKLWASNPAGRSQVVSVPITVTAMDRGMVGRFVGVFGMHPELNDQLGGCFKLDTTSAATFTGSVQQGSRTWKLSGRFDDVSNVDGMSFERWLPLDGVPNAIRLWVTVKRDSTAVATWQVGDQSIDASGFRRSSATRGTVGRHNLLAEVAPLQRDIVTETPITVGFMTAVVDGSGNVTFSGRMGDGEAVTGSSIWAADGTSPFHQRLYGAAGGSANGHLRIAPDTSTGRLHWIKKPNTEADLYPEGWNPLALDLTGGRFIPPTIAQVIEALMRSRPSAPQVRIEFSGGGLPEDLTGLLKPSLEGLTVQSAAASISGLKLSYSWMTTGSLSGSFRVNTGHHVVFHALEIQAKGQIVGLCKVTQPDGSVLLGSVVVHTDPEL